jgi:glycosyltransferase 2 family protein
MTTPPTQTHRKTMDRGQAAVLSTGASLPSIETGLVEIAPALFGKVSGTRTLLFWVIGVLGFLALILAVVHFGSLERLINLVRTASPAWLLLALLVQALTYVSAALVWHQALRRAHHALTLRALVPLGIAKVFTDQVLPSGGISGTMLVVRGLIRRRVPPEVAMAAMLAGMVSYDIAYLIVVVTSAGILRFHNAANLALLIGVV